MYTSDHRGQPNKKLVKYFKKSHQWNEMKWNESGFRPPLCTYRLNWARRTSWGWLDDWDDTVLQTQDSKFEPWRSEAEHVTSRSRRLPAILTFTRGWGRNIFCFFQTAETGNRTPSSGVKGSGANHYPRAPAQKVINTGSIIGQLGRCWPSVGLLFSVAMGHQHKCDIEPTDHDACPTLGRHWLNVSLLLYVSNETRDTGTMSAYCWSIIYDVGPTLNQH